MEDFRISTSASPALALSGIAVTYLE